MKIVESPAAENSGHPAPELVTSSAITAGVTPDLPLLSPTLFLRKGSFSANVFALTAGGVLAQALNAAATLILARIFTPEDFGLLALFMAITSFVSAVGSWRYETAIMLPEKDEEAANLQLLSLLVLLGMCALSLVGVVLFQYPMARMLREPRLAPWLWGVPISLFVSGLYQILNYWCGRRKQFRRLAVSGVCQSLATIGSQLGLFALGLGGPVALVFGWIAGQAVGTAFLAVQALREDAEFVRRSFDWASLRSGLFKYKNFPIYTTPYGFVGNAAQQSVFVALRVFANVQVVGLFSMARRAVYLPVNLLSSSMRPVFYEKAATELKSGRLEPLVLRILKLQVALGTPALIFFVFEAKFLFRTVLGGVWAASAVYAALLAFSAYMEFVTTWMDRIFDVQGRQNLALLWEISRDIAMVGSLTLALGLSGNPVLSIGVYVAVNFLFVALWLLLAFKIANFAVGSLWQIGALFLGTSSVATAMLWAIHLTPHSWEAFVLSSLLTIALEGFFFMKYTRGSRLL